MLRQTVTLLVCFAECVMFGGTMYGWPSLVYVLKHDGVYHHLCPLESPSNNTLSTSSIDLRLGNRTDQPGVNRTSYIVTDTHSKTSDKIPPSHVTPEGHVHRHDLACGPQDHHLALAIIFCVLVQGLAAFPLGRLFDRTGLRFTRILGCVAGFIGYNLLAFTHEGAASWLIFLGTALCGISMNIIVMTNCYVAQLAGSRTSTVVALYNGAVMASSTVLLVIKLMYDAGISRMTAMTVYSCMWILVLFSTCALLPKYKIKVPRPLPQRPNSTSEEDRGPEDSPVDQYIPTSTSVMDEASDYIPEYELAWSRGLLQDEDQLEMEPTDVTRRQGQPNSQDEGTKPWVSYVRSSLYILYLYWFAALHLRTQVFISTFNTWINSLVDGDEAQVSHYTNVYGFMSVSSIIISPISGVLMDLRRKRLKANERYGLLGAMAAAPSLTITTALAIFVSLLTSLKVDWCIYVTIAAFTVLIVFLYPTGVAFIGQTWPARHYGTLFGATFTVLGFVAFIQYPFVLWAGSSPGGDPMNVLLLFIAVFTFLHPGNIFYQYRKRKHSTGNDSLPDSCSQEGATRGGGLELSSSS